MKALVVGYGSIGNRHIENLIKLGFDDIILCTSRKDCMPIKKEMRVYDTLKNAMKEKPDVVIITNVTNQHVKTAIQLAKINCHLFVEKPLSDSLLGIEQLLRLVKRKKLITLIGCNMRFHPCIKKIKELISKNTIGKIISVRVESGSYLPDWHPLEDYRSSYASRKDLGGGVVLTCIHEIDYLYWFFGKPTKVFSMTGKYSDLDLSVEDLSAILIRFKNNIIAEIHLDYFQRPDFRSCKIIGTKGTIYWDSDANAVKVYDIKKKKWIEKLKVKNYDRNSMYIDELAHFLKSVRMKNETINSIYHGVKTLKIALAVKKSSKIEKVIKFDKK